jgi:hypothetical protein
LSNPARQLSAQGVCHMIGPSRANLTDAWLMLLGLISTSVNVFDNPCHQGLHSSPAIQGWGAQNASFSASR